MKKNWLLIALLSIVIHGAWIHIVQIYMPDCGAPPYKFPYNMGDSGSYALSSQALFDSRPMAPLFRERIIFPIFLAAGNLLGNPARALWLMLPLHGLAVIAICYITSILSSKRWVPLVSGLLYVLTPSFYFFGIELGTDVLHAHLAVCATALAIAWPRTLRVSHLAGTSLLWMATQLTRPTYFPIGFGLLLLWWPCMKNRYTRVASAFALVATLLVPVYFICTNASRYGVFTPTFCGFENIHTIITPRIRMFQRHSEDPSRRYSRLFSEERDKAMQNPDYLALKMRAAEPPSNDFRSHYRHLMQYNVEYIKNNKGLFLKSGMMELRSIIMACGRSPAHKIIPGNPAFAAAHDSVIRKTTRLALPLGLLGLIIALTNRQWKIVAFASIFFAMVFIPSIMLWWQGDRIRLSAELLMMPFVALSLGSLPGLGFIAGTTLLGYIPFKTFQLPENYLKWTIWLCLVLAVFAVLVQRSKKQRLGEGNGD